MTARPFDRRLVRTAFVLALPIAFFGCGSAPGDVAVGADSAAVGAAGSAQARSAGYVADRPDSGLTLPLDAYAFSADEDQVLAQVAEAQVRACLESYGLDSAAAGPLPFGTAADTATTAAQRHERRYAVADAEVAATYGYHPPETTDVRREFYESHTAAELEVLVGVTADGAPVTARHGGKTVPDGGCLGQAALLTPTADQDALRSGEELVSGVQADAWHSALSDPRVVEAFAVWSACIAAAGYQYDAPMQANDDPAWWQSDTASAEEIATATADVACKESTGLIPAWSAVEAEHQAALIERNRAGLDAYRALLDQQVAQARAALP